MKPAIYYNSWVWLGASVISLGLCAYLPILIKNDPLRRLVNWVVLIPVSIFIILYVYPTGLEVFRKFALSK